MSDVSVRDLIWFDPGLFEARDLFMVTSAGRRGLRTGDVYDLFFNKCYDLPPGNSVSIAEVDGPGVCVRLNITLPHMVFPHSLSDLELTVRIDDNVHAAIQGPIGDLFCCPFGRWRPFRLSDFRWPSLEVYHAFLETHQHQCEESRLSHDPLGVSSGRILESKTRAPGRACIKGRGALCNAGHPGQTCGDR